MNKIPEEVVKLAESGEVKTTNLQEVAFAVHNGSYQKLGEVFGKLAQGIEENEIAGPSVTVCYNDPHTTPEEALGSECPFSVWEREDRFGCVGVREKKEILIRRS